MMSTKHSVLLTKMCRTMRASEAQTTQFEHAPKPPEACVDEAAKKSSLQASLKVEEQAP